MNWISIDPGKKTGMVAWENERIVAYELAQPPSRATFDEWLPYIVGCVREFGQQHQAVLAAIERPFIDPSKPAPELNALVRSLYTMARRQKWAARVYPQATVKKHIRPGGCRGMGDKEMLRLGVRMVYGPWVQDIPQDVVDAIACGHCHLAQLDEAAILEQRTI